jgi:hypothetical protein
VTFPISSEKEDTQEIPEEAWVPPPVCFMEGSSSLKWDVVHTNKNLLKTWNACEVIPTLSGVKKTLSPSRIGSLNS